MRKFSKLLTLILSLVLIVAAFTVVALAEESPAPKKINNGYGSFDSRDEGYRLSYDRNAWATVQIQDNGNKYMLTHDAPEGYKENNYTGTESNWTNPQMDIGTGIDTTYNILDYPYFLLEFDVTTLNGTYNGFSLNPRIYQDSTSLGFLGGTKLSDIAELSKISYDWKHFSLIIEYNGGGKFTQHIYVNGEFVKSIPGTDYSSKITSEAIEKKVALKYFKAYPNTSSDLAIDNMYFTLFRRI